MYPLSVKVSGHFLMPYQIVNAPCAKPFALQGCIAVVLQGFDVVFQFGIQRLAEGVVHRLLFVVHGLPDTAGAGVKAMTGVIGLFGAGAARLADERVTRIQVVIDRLTLWHRGFFEQRGANASARRGFIVEHHQGFNVTAHQVFKFLSLLEHPFIDPAHHRVLFLRQVTHHREGVVKHQVQMVVFIGRQQLAFDRCHVGVFEQRRVFPDVILCFLSVPTFDRGGICRWLSHLRQPLFGLGWGEQVRPAFGAIGCAQVDHLHEVIPLGTAVDHF